MRFVTASGKKIEVERETRTLKFNRVYRGDYFRGKEHDNIVFTDEDNNEWIYINPCSYEESLTALGKEMSMAKEGTIYKISGLFLKDEDSFNQIYRPRLLQ